MERRVLVIPADRSYITVETGQTAESYTAGLRQKYITALVLAGAYALLYVAAWCILILIKKTKRGSQVRYGKTTAGQWSLTYMNRQRGDCIDEISNEHLQITDVRCCDSDNMCFIWMREICNAT